MFIVALYIIDKLEIAQMPLNCDTTIIEWYLEEKKEQITTVAMKWMNLTNMLS